MATVLACGRPNCTEWQRSSGYRSPSVISRRGRASETVEHRLFSFISSNWRGEPLLDYETIVRLIARTTTAKGLSVTCRLDHRKYPTGRKISDAEMAAVNLTSDTFHGEWNYVIRPNKEGGYVNGIY